MLPARDCFPSCPSHCRSMGRPVFARCTASLGTRAWATGASAAVGEKVPLGSRVAAFWLCAGVSLRRAAWMLPGWSGRPSTIVLPESDWTAGFTASSRASLAAEGGYPPLRGRPVRGYVHACGTQVRQKKKQTKPQGCAAGQFGWHAALAAPWRTAPSSCSS
jgi:hypothetical protein